MFKLIKYLRKSTFAIAVIVMLLVIQAVCDLALPEYTSNIVNVGIQQGGVEDAVPSIIRESQLEKILLFLDEDDKEYVLDNYSYIDSKDLSDESLDTYKDKYPEIVNEPLYELKNVQDETRQKLNDILAKPSLVVSGMEGDSSETNAMKEELINNLPKEMLKSQGSEQTGEIDVFKIFSIMPVENFSKIKSQINEKFDDMPDAIITQGAVSAVRAEYEVIGIDTDKNQKNYILLAGAKMLLIAFGSMIASVVVGYIAAKVAGKVGRDLRGKVFSKVLDFSSAEMDKFSTASLITRSTNDIQQIQMLMVMLLRLVFYAPILGIGGVIKVFSTNTSMAWIIGVAVLSILGIVIVMFAVVMPKFKMIQKLVDKLNLVTREILTGLQVIRVFGTEKHEEERFDKANKDLTKVNLFVNRIMSCMMPIMFFIMNAISVLIVWVGAKSIDSGTMQVGDMMAFIQYTMQIIISFLMLSVVSVMLPRASVSANRIDEVLTTELMIKDSERKETFDIEKKGVVEFNNVSFKYPDADENILSNISFTAKPGQTTAFIGSTGSGKSTLINLIPRLFDVTEGQILFDGVDVRNVSQHDLREKIGYVPQKGVLFSGTIDSNLKYGKKDATEKEVERAARIAQATEFISTMPDGYKSEISQGGTNVSGGQKQRLSIARAIAKNPEVYIFDDSFSALDFKTDSRLRKALKDETGDSTVLIVAQRISTILHADQIIVVDEGKIVGIGTHKELLKNCEVYNEIASSQLSKEELENE